MRSVSTLLAFVLALSACAADATPIPVPPVATIPVPASPPPAVRPSPPLPSASAPPAAPPAPDPPVGPREPAPGSPARGPIALAGARGTATLAGDQLSVALSDRSVFSQTCNDAGRISVKDGASWKATTDLPPKGNYVLDGKYVGYGMCDVMVCGPAHFGALLRQYAPAVDPGGRAAYASAPITGDIKVEFTYFAESTCKSPRTLTVTLTR